MLKQQQQQKWLELFPKKEIKHLAETEKRNITINLIKTRKLLFHNILWAL
jgi:hypothetical protein